MRTKHSGVSGLLKQQILTSKILNKDNSRFAAEGSSGDEKIDDLLDCVVGLVVGGFEFSGGALDGLG
jgi:hypothetical protein